MPLIKTIKINCDTCAKELTGEPGYCSHYILHVQAKDIAPPSSVIYAMIITPPINHDLYFCGIGCMKNYLDNK